MLRHDAGASGTALDDGLASIGRRLRLLEALRAAALAVLVGTVGWIALTGLGTAARVSSPLAIGTASIAFVAWMIGAKLQVYMSC